MRKIADTGKYGTYGGRFIPETIVPALEELTSAYLRTKDEPSFKKELSYYLSEYAGRPTPLYFAERLTERLKGPKIYLKREDLLHTGAHKINNCLGQILLAIRMGKKRIIAETGAGQHGTAVATVCAQFGLKCRIYMGEDDVVRQEHNVFRMRLMGAEVVPVRTGSRTLKDAINEALRDWITNVADTYYLIGSVVGPHPYPMIVADFQEVIGREARAQILKKEGRLPDCILACVGGGSNAIGMFQAFLGDPKVRIFGVEAAGDGLNTPRHSATLSKGRPGVFHGFQSYFLQDKDGQIMPAHSVAPGLDYPGVGPQHSHLKDTGRVRYVSVNDRQAVASFRELSMLEGIIPALESAHALAYLHKLAPRLRKNQTVIVNISGRGDKDLGIISLGGVEKQ